MFKKKFILTALFLAVVVPLFAELVLQATVRIFESPKRLHSYIGLMEGKDTGLYEPDMQSLYKHKPGKYLDLKGIHGSVTINADGFRSENIKSETPKGKGEIRILLVGGSTTFGLIADEHVWSKKLSYNLQSLLPGYYLEVINAGVGGYTTKESIAALNSRGLAYQPDIVLIHHVYNDVNARTVNPGFLEDYSHYRLGQWRHDDRLVWLKWSLLYNFVRISFSDARYFNSIYYMTVRGFDGAVYYSRQDMEERMRRLSMTSTETFGKNLKTLVDVSKTSGALPVLMTGPLSETSWMSMQQGVREGNDEIRRIASQNDVLLIDLAVSFPAEDKSLFRNNRDPMHMSIEGADVKAKLVGKSLANIIMERFSPAAIKSDGGNKALG